MLTSCGRWDLLTQSIDTFLAHNQPGRFIVVEDSGDEAFATRIRERYPAIEVALNNPRLGQHRAIDKAYAMVTTPWIVHLEDDWFFTGPLALDDARKVIEADESVIAVCFSVFGRLKLRHRIWGASYVHDGVRYGDMRAAHRESYGFSFYPTLLRRRTWEEHGPYAKFQNERAISKYMKANRPRDFARASRRRRSRRLRSQRLRPGARGRAAAGDRGALAAVAWHGTFQAE